MAEIHLIEGPVGAGKSTYAGRLALQRQAVHLNLDEWMVTLFRPDRPETDFMAWYAERKDRCIDQIWLVACEILESGADVILELGLVQHAARQAFYHRAAGSEHKLSVTVVDAPFEVRRNRVLERNESQGSTYRMTVSEEIFNLANSAWEAPTNQECRDMDITLIDHQ